jgi:DNA-binding transcriptional ArsR family regulator
MGADGPRSRGTDDLRSGAALTEDAVEKLAALNTVVAGLAHPARRQILLTIHFRGEATAGEIAGRFAHKWPTTTRHLRVLEDAGLVRHERRGRTRVYAVDKARLALVSEWLSWFSISSGANGSPDKSGRDLNEGRSACQAPV